MKRLKLLLTVAVAVAFLTDPAQARGKDSNLSLEGTQPVTLYNGGYDKPAWGVVIGYVNKSWICKYDTVTQREDLFGDSGSQFIHGIQMGAVFTPSFDWGLGLRTGLLLEAYESRKYWIREFCDRFVEGDLYIPLHASYRIPFEADMGLDLFGGMGFQWVMSGRYENQYYRPTWYYHRPRYDYVEVAQQEYGNGWPQRVNWQAECGATFRYSLFALCFSYSFGIVDHGIEHSFDGGQTYVTAKHSRQDKMQIAIQFCF